MTDQQEIALLKRELSDLRGWLRDRFGHAGRSFVPVLKLEEDENFSILSVKNGSGTTLGDDTTTTDDVYDLYAQDGSGSALFSGVAVLAQRPTATIIKWPDGTLVVAKKISGTMKILGAFCPEVLDLATCSSADSAPAFGF